MIAQAANLDWFWDRLLQCIDEESVVPVVGSDLLVLPGKDPPVTLQTHLAERLAKDLKLPPDPPLPANGALHEVACRFKAGGGNLNIVYSRLKALLSDQDDLPLPEPLRKLARIRPFKLYLSLTFDALLARAIDEERFGGERRTEVFAYTPSARDPKLELEQIDGPVVFHLFGQLSAKNDYAVTEEDILELFHSFQSGSHLPSLLSSLPRKSLLLLGCSFPDWLTRFFLRIGSGERRLPLAGKIDVVADARIHQDPGLVPFLRNFSPETEIFEDAVAFVDELSARWQALHPETDPPPALPAHPGAIFLSYAREDLEAAQALRQALEDAGMDVWFDKTALRGGDDFEDKIFRAIRGCCLFVPVISRHTLDEDYRYFRQEWTQASKLLDGLPPNRRFLFPVAIDGTSESDEAIPPRFRVPHWVRLPDGRPTPDLIQLLQQEYRTYRQLQRNPR